MIRANKKRTFIGLGLAILLLALASGLVGMGCANDSGEREHAAVFKKIAPEDIPTVGLDVCTNCHFGQTTQWLTGAHANLEAIDHATHAPLALGLDSDGFPYYAYFTDETCATCHDPLGDGQRLTAAWTGNVPRPVIGCESCHGGGAQHYGVGPIAFPKPDHNRCGQCHNASFPAGHLTYHPNGANIVEDYEMSLHIKSIVEPTLATALTAAPEDVRAKCSRCHTDEGFRLYVASVPGTLGYDSIGAILDDQPATEDASPVECRTCHDPHTTDAGDFTRLKTSVLNGDTQSGEFNQCTACHQLNKTDGTVQTQAYHDPSVNPYGSEEEIITDNHAAVPGDTRLNSGPSGEFLYFVKKGSENSCAGCHNPHLADATINKQYAQSGHGDALGDPWIHYPWKNNLPGPSTRESREACQRCHTTTGFVNFANNPAMYDPAMNNNPASTYNFDYLLDGTTTGVDAGNNWIWADHGQLETLYCWGCHRDYRGGLRNPGAFHITTIESTYETMAGDSITFPDASGSNVCVTCHAGRISGGYIQNLADPFTDLGFQDAHYLAAAGVLFRKIGYQYRPDANYNNVFYFEHDEIGSGTVADTGTNGPCVGCHLSTNPEEHLLSPVSAEGETITAITSTACALCHTPEHGEMTVAKLTEEEEGFEAGLEALAAQLALNGHPYLGGYPYFAAGDWTNGASNASIGRNNMGAAFNWNMLRNEPGCFAHNSVYAKRLIYDSIDWLDNGTLATPQNNSVAAALPSLLTGETLTRAQEWLLSDCNLRPGDPCPP